MTKELLSAHVIIFNEKGQGGWDSLMEDAPNFSKFRMAYYASNSIEKAFIRQTVFPNGISLFTHQHTVGQPVAMLGDMLVGVLSEEPICVCVGNDKEILVTEVSRERLLQFINISRDVHNPFTITTSTLDGEDEKRHVLLVSAILPEHSKVGKMME